MLSVCVNAPVKVAAFVDGLLFFDAVHKQRDVVPLNIHSDAGESDDDNEEPVFDFKVHIVPFGA